MNKSNLNYFAMFVSICTFFLIVAGALVTSTGSGLAVPDWPLSFGQFFPPMQGGVFFEHGHRLIAGTVGFLTLGLSIWLWMQEERRWLCWLGTVALGAVAIQAILGGITVLYGLPLAVSASHATLAQTFFCITIAIAYFTSTRNPDSFQVTSPSTRNDARRFFRLSASTTAFIFIQLVLGSVLRHGGGQLFLMSHLIWAVMVLASILALFAAAVKRRESNPAAVIPALLLVIGLVNQVALGVLTLFPMYGLLDFLLEARTPIVTAHVATGAFLLGDSFLISLMSFPHPESKLVSKSISLSILTPQKARP